MCDEENTEEVQAVDRDRSKDQIFEELRRMRAAVKQSQGRANQAEEELGDQQVSCTWARTWCSTGCTGYLMAQGVYMRWRLVKHG
jgi:hypothetical protein